MRQIKAVLIGAGGRGAETYGTYIIKRPNDIKIVAVCEPNEVRRNRIKAEHELEDSACFESWEDLLHYPKMADVALICTQDSMHYEPAVKLMERGYDLLLEKPMSNQLMECIKIIDVAKKYGRKVIVCHVLRYTQFFQLIKSLLDRNTVGKVMNIEYSENVAYWHYAMSYVRGAWAKEATSSPMILAKSCHDLDILNWLIGDECTLIASFGDLIYFKEENAPEGAPAWCQDGCPAEKECPFFAPRFYLKNQKFLHQYTNTTADNSIREKLDRLHKSPYGRCVFRSDNDVVDHQTTILKYQNGVCVTFTMTAFTYDCGRSIRIMGTEGELIGNMVENKIEVKKFLTGVTETYNLPACDKDIHYGGDEGLMDDFIYVMQHENEVSKTTGGVSLMSHVMAFAAEEARKKNCVVDVREYYQRLIKN